MRLAELSARSGVSTATIKFYLREGLLPPGRRLSATQAEYDGTHLRRLRLVRALIQVGGVPVATAREVLAAVDDEGLTRHDRLGAAVWAIPQPAPARTREATAEETAAARTQVAALLQRLGWPSEDLDSPPGQALVRTVAALAGLGYPHDAEGLLPYARAAERAAEADLDMLEHFTSEEEQVEASVALTVLHEPVLLALRRLAQAQESARRTGRPEEW
ncbi:MerR family transcriptional regulator [Streptomyces diacarni]|uniref:MerR family transcriptional regulator n=1 Tax=Streptomyces diacarni TaxID=2800381 RepID=A0A367EPG8_9ACTN|nr:MerR family transcriptional regulator [Streptomyces diacarni]RCG19863.1 MerR family transcriptional regulator [Streptomyces diacarni]